MTTKAVLRGLTPPVLWEFASRLARRGKSKKLVRFEGPYDTWQKAQNDSDGWDASVILDKTLRLSIMLRDGMIEYQQDTQVLSNIVYSPVILSALLLALESAKRQLVIFDVGGSLGTNFYQNRKLISAMTDVSVEWNVIELSATAELGRTHFEKGNLRFFDSIKAACSNVASPQVVIFSGSLQYAADPYSSIEQATATGARFIAVDRLLTSPADKHQIFVQRPDMDVYYAASYPVWCFSLRCFVSDMHRRGLRLIEHFTTDATKSFDHCGMLFRYDENYADARVSRNG